ncbi:LamG domain-containing protein, partial [Candidatus Parcubacteria bacterium]|nr:LamG domain-containing protein [Candidatus Parcubacteria bacterium]
HHGSISGLPAVSLSAWINVGAWSNNLGDINFLAAKSNWSSQREYRIRHQGSTGQVYWQVSDNGTNVAETTVDDSSISVGEWHYLTGTWQTGADNLIFYLDGVAVDTSTLTVASLFGGSADFAIGSSADGGSLDDRDDWDGYIDEVRVSSIVRSSDYIATEFSNQRYPGNFMTVGLDDPRAIGGLKYVIGGYSCELCTIEDTNNNCGTNPYNLNINRCEVCNDGVYYTPGLMIDHKYNNIDSIVDQVAGGCDINQTDPDMDDYCEVGYMCGWGWNAWQDAGVTQGLGWFQFGARINTSTRPYFTADKGSIYSRGSVFSRYNAPFGRYNASYLIESGGTITNIVSSTTLADLYQGELANRPLLDFFNIKSNNKYTNALGTIDYLGLTKVSEQILGTDYNKYNSEIITNPISLTLSAPMDGKVIYFDDTYGNVTIDAYVEVPVGIDSGASLQMGSGVVVVAGNLHFNADVEYETISSPTNFNLKHIPSLVWIVKGSVTVSPDVSNLAGTFIALGSAGVAGECTPHLVNDEISHCIDEAYSLADLDHMCGQFVSCFDDGTATGDCSTNQLSVSGSVIARQFDLCRSYIDVGRPPAELFTNDGRLQANPPPGLVDFSKVIPRFSENLR